MAIKGLKDLHYAIITEENETTTVYGEPKKLGPAISLGLQRSYNRGNLRADDKVLFSDASKGPMSVTLNTAYLTKQVEADILGKTIHENGLISSNASDRPPYIAIGGRAENARGGYDYFWIYRVQLTPAETNMETKQETPTYQTPNLSGEGLPRLHDDEEEVFAWSEDETITDKTIFDEWFNEVVDKNWAPTI